MRSLMVSFSALPIYTRQLAPPTAFKSSIADPDVTTASRVIQLLVGDVGAVTHASRVVTWVYCSYFCIFKILISMVLALNSW